MKKDKKKYVKPAVKKNKPMAGITFQSNPSVPITTPTGTPGP